MTIHHIINDIELANGGAQKIVRVLHTGLRERGVDSQVVTLAENVSEVSHAQSFGVSNVRDPRVISSIRRYLKEECTEQDIVHVHLFPASLFVSLAVRLSGFKGTLVFTEHSTNNRRRGTFFGRCLDSIIYPPYARIACISQGTKNTLVNWMPTLSNRLDVVENGAELTCAEIPHRDTVSPPIIISVGRLHAVKNYDMAIRMMAQLRDLDFEYWIAGLGDEECALKALAQELGIESKVKFLGFVENIPDLLRRSSVFLMPSRWEGFGLSAVEAMNAGLPCVVSDVDGLREVVSDKCAFTIPSEQPNMFIEALRRLLTEPELRVKMGEQGFQRAQLFSADAMVDNYLNFYSSVTG